MVILRSGREVRNNSAFFTNKTHGAWSCRRRRCGHSEADRWRILDKHAVHPATEYAIQALDVYNYNSLQNYQLVRPHGMTPAPTPSCTIFHLNFTAKNSTLADAPTEMFFAELIYSDNVLTVNLCECMGPIGSISGEELNGCCFCSWYNNVLHPEGGGFIRGDDIFYKTVQELCDINMNNTILGNDEDKHLPMFKHVNNAREPQKEGEYTSEQVDDAWPYATEAVTYYNHLTHTNYKLVEPGFITRVNLPTCLLFHISFTAKKTDVAAAPEEMFFAELTSASGVLSFSLCVCMCPTDSISGDKLNGCYYCRKYNNVQHPRDGGFVRGGDSLFKKMP